MVLGIARRAAPSARRRRPAPWRLPRPARGRCAPRRSRRACVLGRESWRGSGAPWRNPSRRWRCAARPASASTLPGSCCRTWREDVGGARRDRRRRALPWPAPGLRRSARRPAAAPASLLDELLDLAFRHRADEAVDRAAVLEGIDRRDRLDAHLLRQLLVLVDVDLDQPHRALGVAHRLFQRRAELLAGAAPRRPEIDDHRARHARRR